MGIDLIEAQFLFLNEIIRHNTIEILFKDKDVFLQCKTHS